MEDKTLQSLEIKRARLRGIRPLTKEEIKVKAEIDMIKYFNKVIDKVLTYNNENLEYKNTGKSLFVNITDVIKELKLILNGKE